MTRRAPTPTTSGTPRSGPSTVSTAASLYTTTGTPTAAEAPPTPERAPRRRNSGAPASNSTPSTEAACGAVSESSIAQIAINEHGSQDGDSTAGDDIHHELRHGATQWEVNLLHNGEWARCSTTRGSLADAEMAGARKLAALEPPRAARG